jgi:L-amino acid N-acyltransferase YncA
MGNIKIRQARAEDAAGIAFVHIHTWKTTYQGMIPQSYLDGLSVEERTERHTRNLSNPENCRQWTVAEDENGKIVGFVCGGKSRDQDSFDSELYAIYVLKEQQGRNIGKMLAKVLAERLVSEGCKTMKVWVIDQNPARKFYEAMGGRLSGEEKTDIIAGQPVQEVAYVWDDIGVMSK